MFDILLSLWSDPVCDQNVFKIFSLDGFYFYQSRSNRIERIAMLEDDRFGFFVRTRNYSLHFTVDGQPRFVELTGGIGWTWCWKLLTQGAWTLNKYNRMRLWIKVPTSFPEAALPYHNLELGTYVRHSSAGDFSASAEEGGNHLYHFYNIPATDRWYQIVFDTHPSHIRSHAGAEEYGDMPHPTSESDRGYMHALTRFYLDFNIYGTSPTSFPGDFLLDNAEFFEDNPAANVAQVYSLGGLYDVNTNRVRVSWQHPKDDGVTQHEVRYAFSDIYALGWAGATAAPSGTIVPLADAHGGMVYDTTAIAMGGNTTLYVAIQPVGASTFNQIVIPLKKG